MKELEVKMNKIKMLANFLQMIKKEIEERNIFFRPYEKVMELILSLQDALLKKIESIKTNYQALPDGEGRNAEIELPASFRSY